ncbi:PREDICTED: uncharacterized protein LOC109152030 [Ipomoea nil]|uniref:uncharacterized protein LOC109152030 n=1 Tax=Ipomoea nil TaxID=35883 RepID=UPI000900DB52|nr:PREDICTED: uncharacterized protein LOC109152030 [Ipomoea nil]
MEVENSQKQHEFETPSSSSAATHHYCKVCKRRFHCAGALGGHMRSHHAAADKPHHLEDDYVVKSYRSKAAEGQKHSYFLRTNTNRFVCNRDQDRHYDNNNNKSLVTMPSREEEDLANCLVMLSSNGPFVLVDEGNKAKEMEKGLFQCKACKKVFNSHQALGGHRASHKKVKGCYAAKLDNVNNDNEYYLDDGGAAAVGPQHSDYNSLPSPPPPLPATALSRKRSRVHQCSICHRIFSSGQALGGHKRCHWLASGMTEATLIQNFQEIAAYDHSKSPPLIFKNPAFMATPPPHPSPLDLNFPPLLPKPAGDITNAGKSRFEPPETPTRSYMNSKLWGTEEFSSINTKRTTNTNHHNHHQNSRNNIQFADEKPKMKSPKLSDLKDLKLDGGSASGWLQMGIASSTPDIVACHALI